MEPIVHENATAAKRLAELDLAAADLINPLIGADLEARTWTPLAPPMMAGLARWGKTNELLRARLVDQEQRPLGALRAGGRKLVIVLSGQRPRDRLRLLRA